MLTLLMSCGANFTGLAIRGGGTDEQSLYGAQRSQIPVNHSGCCGCDRSQQSPSRAGAGVVVWRRLGVGTTLGLGLGAALGLGVRSRVRLCAASGHLRATAGRLRTATRRLHDAGTGLCRPIGTDLVLLQ